MNPPGLPALDFSLSVTTPVTDAVVEPNFATCGSYYANTNLALAVYYKITPLNTWTAAQIDTVNNLWQAEITNANPGNQTLTVGLFAGNPPNPNTPAAAGQTIPLTVQAAGAPGTVMITTPPGFVIHHDAMVRIEGRFNSVPRIWRENYTLECVLHGKNSGRLGKIVYCNFWEEGESRYGSNYDGVDNPITVNDDGTWIVNFGLRDGFQTFVARMRVGQGYHMDYKRSTDVIHHTASRVILRG